MKPSEPSAGALAPEPDAHAAPAVYPYSSSLEPGNIPGPGGLVEYWRVIRRHRGALFLCAFSGALIGLLYSLPQTPVYQARVALEVQPVNENFMNLRDVSPNAAMTSTEPDLQTCLRVLQTRALLRRVVSRLGLTHRRSPESPSRLDEWRRALHLLPPESEPGEERAIDGLAANVRGRTQPNTRILEITCDSTDPHLAAELANTTAAEFIEENLEARWKNVERTGEWLTRQMEDLRIKLEKSEEELQSYARLTGLQFTAEKDNAAEARLKQIQEELGRAQADRIARQSIAELIARAGPSPLPDALDDAALKEFKSKLADLLRERAGLSATLTPAHPRLRKIEAQITSLQGSLASETTGIAFRIRNEYEAAVRREKLLSTEYLEQSRLVSGQAEHVTHYTILKHQVDTYRQLYDNILQRVSEAGIASALRASNIRIIDPALSPRRPYKPDPAGGACAGLFAGFIAGLAFVVLRDRADRTVREPGDASSAGIPEIGLIPSASAGTVRTHALLSFRPTGAALASVESLALVSLRSRPSVMAESFRTALSSLVLSARDGRRPRVILLSSAAPRAGKTTVASNLAIALAETGQRVLLIDADMRRPRLDRIFDLPNEFGLSDLLRSKEPIRGPVNGLAHSTMVPNLSVLTSGRPGSSDTALLYSGRLSEIIAAVRSEYDTVLIDTPPMLAMADARLIARFADGVVLVARANQTSRDAIRLACKRFLDDGTPVLGAILNDWNPKRSSQPGYYRDYVRDISPI